MVKRIGKYSLTFKPVFCDYTRVAEYNLTVKTVETKAGKRRKVPVIWYERRVTGSEKLKILRYTENQVYHMT